MASVVVCLGETGISQRVLAHGVPVVVVPFGRDQLEVAQRVEHAGAGVRLLPKKLNATSRAAAVQDALSREAGARQVAQAFAEAGGEAVAADVFEELLADQVGSTDGRAIVSDRQPGT